MRIGAAILSILFVAVRVTISAETAPADWSMNASIIEACSCPMFCQCYFNAQPAAHGEHVGHSHGEGGEHFCKFNNAYKVNRGSYANTKLDGAKFWVAGDLGGDFSKGQMDWAALTFDPSVTPEQREGIKAILGHIYPVKWNSFTMAKDAKMTWAATRDHAEAKLGDGTTAQVTLNKFKGMTDEPIVIKNLRYWAAALCLDELLLLTGLLQLNRHVRFSRVSLTILRSIITLPCSSRTLRSTSERLVQIHSTECFRKPHNGAIQCCSRSSGSVVHPNLSKLSSCSSP